MFASFIFANAVYAHNELYGGAFWPSRNMLNALANATLDFGATHLLIRWVLVFFDRTNGLINRWFLWPRELCIFLCMVWVSCCLVHVQVQDFQDVEGVLLEIWKTILIAFPGTGWVFYAICDGILVNRTRYLLEAGSFDTHILGYAGSLDWSMLCSRNHEERRSDFLYYIQCMASLHPPFLS